MLNKYLSEKLIFKKKYQILGIIFIKIIKIIKKLKIKKIL